MNEERKKSATPAWTKTFPTRAELNTMARDLKAKALSGDVNAALALSNLMIVDQKRRLAKSA